MHESSLGKEVLRAVLERAAEEKAKRVSLVRGWIAETERLIRRPSRSISRRTPEARRPRGEARVIDSMGRGRLRVLRRAVQAGPSRPFVPAM